MKKLFFAMAISLLALSACFKSKDKSRDQYIADYSVLLTRSDGTIESTPNQICNVTASSTGDSNITFTNLINNIVTATVNQNSFSIPSQSVGGSLISGSGTLDINRNIQISFNLDYTLYYEAILTRI